MGELHKKFVKQVQITENVDASRVFRLKSRLTRDYPQLVFHRPQARNQSEFVFIEEMSVGQVFESNSSKLEQSNKYSGYDESTGSEPVKRWRLDVKNQLYKRMLL